MVIFLFCRSLPVLICVCQTGTSAEERCAVRVEGAAALPAGSAPHEEDVPGGTARPRWPQRVQHAVRRHAHHHKTHTHIRLNHLTHLTFSYFHIFKCNYYNQKVPCLFLFVRYHNGDAYIIDVSQSVEHDHPHALEFLRKDCSNVNGEVAPPARLNRYIQGLNSVCVYVCFVQSSSGSVAWRWWRSESSLTSSLTRQSMMTTWIFTWRRSDATTNKQTFTFVIV